jgi:hypothetical protein
MPEQQKTVESINFLYRVELWGGLSVLASLISVAFPWWGIDLNPSSYSWGVL